MLQAEKNNATIIYFTAKELAVNDNEFYLLICINRLTGDKVTQVIYNTSTDDRYQTAEVTIDGEVGLWSYKIVEIIDENDTSEDGNVVEEGYLNLFEGDVTPTYYTEQENEFIAYDGN